MNEKLKKEIKCNEYFRFLNVSHCLTKTIGYGWYRTKNAQIFQFFEQQIGENFYQFVKKLVKNGAISRTIKWLILIKNQHNLNLGSHTEAFISHFIKKKTVKNLQFMKWKDLNYSF